MNAEQIAAITEEHHSHSRGCCYAIRALTAPASVGDMLECSYDWRDDSPTCGQQLDGTCGIGINRDDEDSAERAMRLIAYNRYDTSHGYAVIAGSAGEYGDDEGEIIKDISNVIRNVKRRVTYKTCRWCGKEMPGDGTPRSYCSPECRREALRLIQARADAKRYGKPEPVVATPRRYASDLLRDANLDRPASALARESGLTKGAVYQYLKTITAGGADLWALLGRMPDSALARRIGVSHTTVRKRRVQAGIAAFCPHQRIDWDAWAAELSDNTISARDLAHRIGCDVSTVRERRRALRGDGGKYGR